MSSLKACLHSSVTSRSKLMTRSVILGTKDANNLDPIIYSIIVYIFKRQAPHQKRKVAHKKMLVVLRLPVIFMISFLYSWHPSW